MKTLALIVAGALVSTAADAAGVDSRTSTCGALQALIATRGFVFISQPAFGDFVVAGPHYCSGGQLMRLRSVPTLDRADCSVNYCEPRDQAEQQ